MSAGAAALRTRPLALAVRSCNRLGNSGAASLARALAAPASALEVLVLANNRIGDPGLEALSGSLNDSATLAELDLRGNRLLDEGVCALADALVANRTLTNLNLSCARVRVRARRRRRLRRRARREEWARRALGGRCTLCGAAPRARAAVTRARAPRSAGAPARLRRDNGVGDEGAQALMDVMRRTGGQSVIASMCAARVRAAVRRGLARARPRTHMR